MAWLIDSGASSNLWSILPVDAPKKVHLGDGNVIQAVGVGNIRLHYDVLYVPKLTCNFFFNASFYQKRQSNEVCSR